MLRASGHQYKQRGDTGIVFELSKQFRVLREKEIVT